MKIAVFASNYPPHSGGLEIVVHNVAVGLAVRHEVVVVTTAWEGRSGVAKEHGLVVHRLPTVHATEPMGVPYPVPLGPGLRAALSAAADADLCHAHGALYVTSVLAAQLARRRHVPLILTEHVGFVHYRSAGLNRLQRAAWATVGRHVLRRTTSVTVLNARVHAWFAVNHARTDVHTIGNGVDHARFRPHNPQERDAARQRLGLPGSGTLVLFVGRHAEKKNLEAVLSIPRHDFTLVTCGAPGRSAGERQIDLGVVPWETMPDLYAAVDVMIHASTGEGFPVAVQEAMASGVPIVLLWDDGYGDTLDHAAVQAVSSLDDLAAGLRTVLREPARSEDLGRRAREWATRHWGWDRTITAYEELFARSVDASGSARRGGG